MKKLLLIYTLFATSLVYAQKDISVSLSVPAAYSSIVNGASQSASGIVTNLGAPLSASDTIIVYMTLNGSPIQYTSGGNTYTWGSVLTHGAIATNSTVSFSLNALTFTITAYSGATMCAVATLQNGGNVDGNTANNTSCNPVALSKVSGVNEVQSVSNSIKVYPNPAREAIDFSVDGNIARSISIMDITGKQIESLKILTNDTHLNLENYSSGIYLYQIKTEDGQLIKSGKFTVSK